MMGSLRFRRSVKIAPGLRLTASKTGLGLSAGVRGARYSVHSSGRRTASVGVPGSGVGYQHTTTSGSRTRSRDAAAPVYSDAPVIPKPGLLAPKYEKEFAKAVSAYLNGDPAGALAHFKASSAADTKERGLSDDLFVGLLAAQIEDDVTAIASLEKVVTSDQLLPDQLMSKYVPGGSMQVGVTDEVTVSVPFGTLAATVVLAQVYRRQGRLEEATGLAQQLYEIEASPDMRLLVCSLLREAEAWDEIVDVAAGTHNTDDVTLAIRLMQGEALERQGMDEAALEVYRECLKSKARDQDLLRAAKYGRGSVYLRLGKTAQGRKDLSAVYADAPHYRNVAELLKQDGAS